MTDDEKKVIRLEAAQADVSEDAKAYGTKLPWRFIVPALLVIAAVFGWLWWKDVSEMAAIRGRIVTTHTRDLQPVRERFEAMTRKIENWTLAEIARTPVRVVDTRLDLDALHRGKGLYLRVRASSVTSPETLRQAAKQMQPDAITRCLGLAPVSARGLYESSGVLDSAWLEEVEKATSVLRLRVLDDELTRRIQRDLPAIVTTLEADWFLLAIERGDNRRDGAVDMYLWDTRSGANLLALRTEAAGLLIPTTASFGGETRPMPAGEHQSGAANDCSIAGQVREATGRGVPTTTLNAAELLPPPPPLEPAPAPEAAEAPAAPTGNTEAP